MTWVSDQLGWALATTPSCAGVTCVVVLGTTDGGEHWTILSQLDACLTSCAVDAEVVSGIRFATPAIGYLYGSLYGTSPMMVTTDGGVTWSVETGPYAVALDISGGEAMRISSPHAGCPGPCDMAIDTAPLGSNDWSTVFVPTPTYQDGAALARQGADVYALFSGNPASGASSTQHADLYISQDGGLLWRHQDDPCGGTGTAPDDAVSIAAATQGVLAVLCVPRQGGSDFVIVSTDAGATYGIPRTLPLRGSDQIAAASARSLVVANAASGGSGPFVYQLVHSADGGVHWKIAVTYRSDVSQVVPQFLGFEDPSHGRWIGPADILWTTADSGDSWTQSQF